MAGIVLGLLLYVVAFFINTPTESCIARFAESSAESGVTVATAASARTEWVGIVASRCEWTFVTDPGTAVSERVVEWGPSAVAGVGLMAAGAGAWVWLRGHDGLSRFTDCEA